MGRTYLVTGSTGYIGQHLLSRLVTTYQHEPNVAIYGLSRKSVSRTNGWIPVTGDLFLPDLPRLLEELQPDGIFHTIAAPPTRPLSEQIQVNVMGTHVLLQALVTTQQTPRVVVIGSSAEYGLQPEPVDEGSVLKPNHDHGVAKAAQTHTALSFHHQYHLPVLVARLFQVYGDVIGPRSASPLRYSERLLSPLASQIARLEQSASDSKTIHLKNLWTERDYVHIQDAVSALMVLMEKGHPGHIYNVSSNQAVALQEVLDILLSFSRLKQVTIESEGERIHDFLQGISSKINIHTGWHPHLPLETGLKRELEYWRRYSSLLAAL